MHATSREDDQNDRGTRGISVVFPRVFSAVDASFVRILRAHGWIPIGVETAFDVFSSDHDFESFANRH